MALLELKIPFPSTSEDYQKIGFAFDTKQIHPIDEIDLHKQDGEMIYSTLTSSTMATSKLQVLVSNIESQLKLEKISTVAKDTKIKSLEDMVIKLGYDRSNVKDPQEIIQRKNVDIQALRKTLKLPTTKKNNKLMWQQLFL